MPVETDEGGGSAQVSAGRSGGRLRGGAGLAASPLL